MLLTLLFLFLATSSAFASIPEQINSLPVLDALNRSENPLSNGGKWSALSWATNSSGHATGQDTSTGWAPYDAFSSGSNGAYWNPSTFSDTSGSAAAITMQASPNAPERYISLWLDMPSPGSARSGYELRWTFNANLSLSYTVKLSKWSSGTQTVLASNAEVAIPNGTTMAISDTGGTVTAWKGSGGTLTSVISASDSTYSSGYAGIEGAGNFSRSQNFKAGSLNDPATAVNSLPILDALNRSENPLSNGGKWSALNWATKSSNHATGQDTTAGWGPYDAFLTGSNGAYWNPSTFSDTSGSAAAITMQAYPEIAERYISLWLDMPSPGSVKSGYELRWTLNSNLTTYTVKLSKWSSGTQTVLASNAEVSIPNGTTMAISDTGGTVTAWKGSAGTLTSVLSASDSTYSSGYAGIEAAGNVSRSQSFKAGSLGLPAPPDTTISGGPSGVVVPNLSFSFTASPNGGASFECSLDGASYASCASPKSYQGLAEGPHTFRVRASNGAGTDQTPAERSFQVVSAAKAVTKVLGLDHLERQEVPLATGKWSKTNWSGEIGGSWCCGTYRGFGSSGSALAGAYWNPSTFSDGGTETVLVSGKVGTGAPFENEYLALWLDMPNPGTARSGYEARFTGVNGSPSNYKVELSKWVSGTRNILASTAGFSLPVGTTIALTETSGGSLGLWTGTSSLATLLTANDSTYSSGNAGLEVNGGAGTIYDFRAGRIDIQPPDTMIQSGPSGVVSAQEVSFTFTATESASTFECSIDAGAYTACSSPKDYESLAPGSHAFRVRAVDAVGNQDGTPAERSFEVAQPPTVTTGAATAVGSNEATLQGSVNPNKEATTYQFEYGTSTAYGKTIPATPESAGSGDQSVAVEEPVAGLEPDTIYHFRIAANNLGGTSYGEDLTFTTLADTESPETTITEGAYSTTAQTATAFMLESDEFGSTFECRLDGEAWQSCSLHPGYANLEAGPHHFEARAVSEEGIVDPTPAQRDWVIDPSGPLVKPKVEGAPRIGRTLSVSKGIWGGSEPTSYSYQWYRCPSGDPARFGTCQAIPGATNPQYQLTQADQGQHLVAQVTANRSGGNGGQGLAAQTTSESQTTTLSRFSLPALIEVIRSAVSERLVFNGCEGEDYLPEEEVLSPETCGLWMTNAVGTTPVLVWESYGIEEVGVREPWNPTLSKDGSLIAYEDPVEHCIMVVPAEANGSPKEVDCSGGAENPEYSLEYHSPAFTPDGKIVYSDDKTDELWQINVNGTGKEALFTWGKPPGFSGGFRHLSVSPDGSHLAFSSYIGPSGEEKKGMWVTAMNGTEARFIQSQFSDVDWSPDGSKLVLTFDETPATSGNKVSIYNLASDTRTNYGPSATENWSPTWSADGKLIAVARMLPNYEKQIALIDPATGVETSVLGDFFSGREELQLSFRLGANTEATTPDDLLERYEPVVYYHPEESYFADSANWAIEWHENLVYEVLSDFFPLVVADHVEGGSNETLDPEWFRNRTYSELDVLDEQGDNQEAADLGHVQPGYANHVYADEITSADGKVEWLQYWFFYYYNGSVNGAGTEYGTHEGDWEFVEYAYDPETEQITEAAYDQHDEAETCPSNALHYVVTPDGRVAPAVYSAKASHASYFHPGDYNLEKTVFHFGNDLASGEAGPTELTLSRLNEEPWFAWEGHWGGTFPGTYFLVGTLGDASPTGPGLGANEKEMVDPDRVAEEGKDCSPE
jgi:hypothetical protein